MDKENASPAGFLISLHLFFYDLHDISHNSKILLVGIYLEFFQLFTNQHVAQV
uniref:Uncharacterized protein n=1 Tax=Arundo donax TaxID=35708 RepID=A0A0A9GE80_ARUDO